MRILWGREICIVSTSKDRSWERSTGVALFVGDWAVVQLWLFWVAPVIGGILGLRFIASSAVNMINRRNEMPNK